MSTVEPRPWEGKVVNRRAFVQGAAGLVAGAAVLPGLASCASASATSSSEAVTSAAEFPAYVEFKGVSPDLPGTADGVEPGYYSYPTNPVRSVPRPPLSGGTVSAFLLLQAAPPAPEASNAAWQAVNKALGGEFQSDLVPQGQFQEKLSTTLASSQLPDLIGYYTGLGGGVNNFPEFLEEKCTDLTPYLKGDGVKEWSNLANIPTFAWQGSSINGRVWGIPDPAARSGQAAYCYYENFLTEVGAKLPKNADELLQLLKEVTAPKAGRWGFVTAANQVFLQGPTNQMWGIPNAWIANAEGKFTGAVETPQYQEVIAFNRKLYQAGIFYPDSDTFVGAQAPPIWYAGKAFMVYTGYQGAVTGTTVPGAKVGMMPFPGHNGGAAKTNTFTYSTLTIIPKATEKRVRELLGVCNYFAAPFGTTEYLLQSYGVEGIDWTNTQAGPTQTARGKVDGSSAWANVGTVPKVVFSSDRTLAQAIHQFQTQYLANAEPDPTLGLYSDTATSQTASLTQIVDDGVSDIVAGRRPMSSWKSIVSEWRSQGGNQIRKEYQQAWKQARKKAS